MKIIADLLAHIAALKAHNFHLADEAAKLRDFFEARASADGAAKTQAANTAAQVSIEDLHAKVDETVLEAEAHMAGASVGEAPVPSAPEVRPVTMRAKMLVSGIQDWDHAEGQPVTGQTLSFVAVGGDKVQHGYPEDGLDEDNTFARWSPSGHLGLGVVNPDLIGKIKVGEKYYIDFTLANPAPEPAVAAPEPEALPSIPGGTEVDPESIPAAPDSAPAPALATVPVQAPPTQEEIAAMPVVSSTPAAN